MFTAVKICGITRVADAQSAAGAGAHAIGLVFYPPSARNVQLGQAAEIVRKLPPFVTTVGLFVDAEERFVREVLARVQLDLLQFHGDETPQACERYGVPYIKAVRMRPGIALLEYARRFANARGLLLDTFVEGLAGGSGMRFDWSLIPPALPSPIVLSGGLDQTNVGEAVRRVRPWAVDVSSGVELAKGIKDPQRIAAFIKEVRDAGN